MDLYDMEMKTNELYLRTEKAIEAIEDLKKDIEILRNEKTVLEGVVFDHESDIYRFKKIARKNKWKGWKTR